MILMHGGKTMKILDSHTTHFKSSVEAATKRAIITTLLSEAEMFSPEELERLKIVTLCRRLAERHFPLCLNLMFEQFCNYLFTYHAITAWLGDRVSAGTSYASPSSSAASSPSATSASTATTSSVTSSSTATSSATLTDKSIRIYQELREGLLKHKRVLWEQQMQENITLMLGALKINEIQVQTFLSILGSLSKFISIVEEFGGTMAHTLRETFREHAKVFFAQFHKTRLEQLKDLIEKDTWIALTDVKKGYGIKNFAELQDIVISTMPQQRAYKRRKQSFFEGSSVQANPFAADTDGMDMDELDIGRKKKQIARYKWEETAVTAELLVDFVDELGNLPGAQALSTGGRRPTSPLSPNISRTTPTRVASSAKSPSNNPVLSGAPLIADVTRQLVNFIGEYMHLMQLLPHMTHVVFDGLVQVVEYFIWSVHSFFAISKPVLSNGDRNLAIVIRRIQSDLLLDTTTHEAILAAQAAQAAAQNHGLGSSVLSGIKDTFSLTKDPAPAKDVLPPAPVGTLSAGGTFYKTDAISSPTQVKVVRPRVPAFIGTGSLQQQVSSAVVAASSLKFLRQILMELQPNFLELLGRDRLAKVLSLAVTLAETTVPLRNAIFRYVPQGSINVEKQIAAVGGGQWDSLNEDIRESTYVKPLVKEVTYYIDKLKGMVKASQLPAELLPEMVIQILSFVMELCVEGYSKARRVTTEGHNIMLYDSQEIKASMEKAVGIKNHDWNFLDEYVHAYHFPIDDLLAFFLEHPWYTKSQLSGLVVSGPWNQKEKTKLLDALNYHGAFTASASNSRATSSTNASRSSSRR